MNTAHLQVMDDKQHAVLDVRGTYSATDIERLISQLSEARAQMLPSVPTAPPASGCPEDIAATRAGGDPCVQVAVMRDGLTRFWVRHAGLGWFGFNLPVERASTLANYIVGVTSGREPPPGDSFATRRRKSDTCH